MKCPVCGAAELIHDTRDLPYTYKGETTTIPAVTGEFCPACDESITDMAETERVMREMQAFNKQANAAAERLKGRIRLGDALAEIGRRVGLADQDMEVFQRDKTPAEPMRFE